MTKRAALLLTLLTAPLLASCGTFANTCWFNRDEGGMRVYGGVRVDLESAGQALASPAHEDASGAPLWLPLTDLPLSAVADTATLPFTVPISLWWQLHPGAPREKPALPSLDGDAPPASSPAVPAACPRPAGP